MNGLILSLISGLLTGLSFNLSSFSLLIWFSLAPFIYVLSRTSVRSGILSGIIFTLSFYGLTLFWITNVTKLGLILLLFYISLYAVIFVLLGRYLWRKRLRVITLPCLWIILEFLRENVWCGFGWANLGYSQYRHLYLIQIADLAGVKLLSFLIVMVNVFILQVFLTLKKKGLEPRGVKSIFKETAAIFLVFIICFWYSARRLDGLKASGFHKISVVQPNVPQSIKWEDFPRFKIISRLNDLAAMAEKDSLVIFPEASWPLVVDEDNYSELEQFIRGLNRDVIIGAVTDRKGRFYNEALQFDKQAELIDTYQKIKLVPFGEYVPLRQFLTFISVFNSIGDTSRGHRPVRFVYKDSKFSALICFEDIFPRYVRELSRGNDFLLNITNDAWFKGEPQAGQHFGIMILRAVENRISIVRSANSGISGWVSFKGEIEKFKSNDKEVFFAGVKDFRIALNRERSFYNRYGDFFPFICIIFLFGFIIKEKVIPGGGKDGGKFRAGKGR